MVKSFVLIGLSLVLMACQTKPTKTYEKRDLNFTALVEATTKPIKITEKTVVIDSRSAFDFTMSHIPGSVNLHWSEFVKDKKNKPGKLRSDHHRIVRRLALLGITPHTPVVIVGEGRNGEGEEGRLAWMLLYLGVENVQMAKLRALKAPMTNVNNEPPRENAKFWKPEVKTGIEAERDEVISVITGRGQGKSIVIDVRSEKEYFKRNGFGGVYVSPNIQAINIEWDQFYNERGRPNFKLRKKLRAIGVGLNDRVLVISDKGQRSAAATAALLSMGYVRAANVSGGYEEVTSRPKNRFR